MVQMQYPVFVEGQTLTRDDLNVLRDHLRDRDRSVGRAVGFGVACGLGGEVRSDGLHIAAGTAIDQTGEVLVLPAGRAPLELPPHPDAGVSFPFVVGSAADGFTVVLEATDVEVASTGCSEVGCDGHAVLHTTGVALRVVPGRLATDRVDFTAEPLLARTPLRITKSSGVAGDFEGLKGAIVGRIGDRLDADLRAKLAGLRVEATDLPAVAAYKAAFLNEVLFAALDLLRFEALMAVACARAASRPGVALGRVHQVGAAWVWDCGGGHHWEPPTGLTLALLGGPCADPAKPYVDRIASLVDTFALPPVPAPNDPPKDPPSGGFTLCGKGKLSWRDCTIVVFPEDRIPDRWRGPWVEERFPPDPGNVDPPPWEIYEIDRPDVLAGGVIDLTDAFGATAGGVAGLLETLIRGEGVTPDVQVLTAGQAAALEGYHPAGAVSPSDTVVLVADDLGKVVATGRVSGTAAVRRVGTDLPAATRAAAQALGATTALQGDVAAAGARVGAVEARMEAVVQDVTAGAEGLAELGRFREQIVHWRTGVESVLGGLDQRIAAAITPAVVSEGGRIRADIAGSLPTLVTGAVEQVTAGLLGQVRAEIDAAAGSRADAVRAELGPQIVKATERAVTAETLAGTGVEQVKTAAARVDQLYAQVTTKPGAVVGGVRDAALAENFVRVLDAMRVSVEAAAPPNQLPDVRAHLARAEEASRALREGAAAGAPVEAQRESLAKVMDSLTEAVRLSGAPVASVRNLQREVTVFKEVIGR